MVDGWDGFRRSADLTTLEIRNLEERGAEEWDRLVAKAEKSIACLSRLRGLNIYRRIHGILDPCEEMKNRMSGFKVPLISCTSILSVAHNGNLLSKNVIEE